jgi:hypothetical protein
LQNQQNHPTPPILPPPSNQINNHSPINNNIPQHNSPPPPPPPPPPPQKPIQINNYKPQFQPIHGPFGQTPYPPPIIAFTYQQRPPQHADPQPEPSYNRVPPHPPRYIIHNKPRPQKHPFLDKLFG